MVAALVYKEGLQDNARSYQCSGCVDTPERVLGLIGPWPCFLVDAQANSASAVCGLWGCRIVENLRPVTVPLIVSFVEYLTSDPKKPDPLVEEVIWVLLSGSEFRFNH